MSSASAFVMNLVWRVGIFAKNAAAAITTPCHTGSSTGFRYASIATGVAEPKTQLPNDKQTSAPATRTIAVAKQAPSFDQQRISNKVSSIRQCCFYYYYYFCCCCCICGFLVLSINIGSCIKNI